MQEFGVVTQTHKCRLKPVFEDALGDEFKKLPPAIQDMHNRIGFSVFQGEASIKGSEGWIAAIARIKARMPPANAHMRAQVSIDARKGREVWARTFDDRSFQSFLTPNPNEFKGNIRQRFGANILKIKSLFIRLAEACAGYPISN